MSYPDPQRFAGAKVLLDFGRFNAKDPDHDPGHPHTFWVPGIVTALLAVQQVLIVAFQGELASIE